MICKTNKKQVTIRAIVNFRPFSILFALEEMAASVAPLLVFRWLDRLLRRFIHVAASAAHLPSPMSTSLYPLVALQSPFAQSRSIAHSRFDLHIISLSFRPAHYLAVVSTELGSHFLLEQHPTVSRGLGR